MKEIPMSKGMVAIVDDEDFDKVSQYKWHAHTQGYAGTSVGGRRDRRQVLMHRLIMGEPQGKWIDHINGNKLDNRRSNLRVCEARQNQGNRKLNANNTSGYKGVSLDKARGLWSAKIHVEGKAVYLGGFESKHDAARMYNFWARDIFGEFAKLNVIREEA